MTLHSWQSANYAHSGATGYVGIGSGRRRNGWRDPSGRPRTARPRGVTHTDDANKARWLAEKLWQLRILDDERSAADVNAPILVMSQFTLYANTAKGRRPTWNAAAPGSVAEPLVTAFADALRKLGARVETGAFGAHMHVELVNDGPVTVLLEL